MKHNFRTPHSKDVQIVADCARKRLNYSSLSDEHAKIVLACYHWKKYLEQHNWTVPGWVCSNIARYLVMVHDGKRLNDWALEAQMAAEEGQWSTS